MIIKFVQFFSIFVLLFFSAPVLSAKDGDPVPIFEGIEKTEEEIARDEELVRKSLELTNGDAELAAQFSVQAAWERIARNDPNGAINRLNQAWLIKPDFAPINWGFAVATHIRGDDLKKVERWFVRTEQDFKDNPRLLSDHGRVLEERQFPERAKSYFEQALLIDPSYEAAHIGMIKVARALGDKALEEKHQEIFDGLQ